MLWNEDRPNLIGVVHLLPTPGAPRYAGDFEAILESAAKDAKALAEGGCDAIVVENFGDTPFYRESVPPETIASLALATSEVKRSAAGLPVGVNVLRNDARAALGLAAVCDAAFVRVNVHVGAAVTDQGIIQGDAATTLRERARLCPNTQVLCDVHVKHASPLGDVSIEDSALETLGRGGADAVIVSGTGTGAPVDASELARVRERIGSGRILIGSGLNEGNASELLAIADGAIVGTALKFDGDVSKPVDSSRVERLARFFRAS